MNTLVSLRNRLLQYVALYVPGQSSVRPQLHRWRGAHIGQNVFIGTDALIETEHPEWIRIDDGVGLGARTVLMAHFRDTPIEGEHSIVIERDVLVGPGVIVLPNVTIGAGSVVCAGSVVTRSIPPLTMVRGNPALPIKRCGVPMRRGTPLAEFYEQLMPLDHDDRIDPGAAVIP